MKKLVFLFLLLCIPSLSMAGWEYHDDIDKMRNQTIHSARTESVNKLNFSFPYHGGSTVELYLSRSPKKGNLVYLVIDKGQFLHSYPASKISVKFDDGKIETYRGVGAADASGNVLYIEPESQFIQKLKSSKHLVIEATFFQEGRHQIDFDIQGVNWK